MPFFPNICVRCIPNNYEYMYYIIILSYLIYPEGRPSSRIPRTPAHVAGTPGIPASGGAPQQPGRGPCSSADQRRTNQRRLRQRLPHRPASLHVRAASTPQSQHQQQHQLRQQRRGEQEQQQEQQPADSSPIRTSEKRSSSILLTTDNIDTEKKWMAFRRRSRSKGLRNVRNLVR